MAAGWDLYPAEFTRRDMSWGPEKTTALHAVLDADTYPADAVDADTDTGLDILEPAATTDTPEIPADVTQVFHLSSLPQPRPELRSVPVSPDAPTEELPKAQLQPRSRSYYGGGPTTGFGWGNYVVDDGPFRSVNIEGLAYSAIFDTDTTDEATIDETIQGLAAIVNEPIVKNNEDLFMNWLEKELLTRMDAVTILANAREYAAQLEQRDAPQNIDKINKFNDNSQFYGFRLFLDANPEQAALVDDESLPLSTRVANYRRLWHDEDIMRDSFYLYGDSGLPKIEPHKGMTGRQILLAHRMNLTLGRRSQLRAQSIGTDKLPSAPPTTVDEIPTEPIERPIVVAEPVVETEPEVVGEAPAQVVEAPVPVVKVVNSARKVVSFSFKGKPLGDDLEAPVASPVASISPTDIGVQQPETAATQPEVDLDDRQLKSLDTLWNSSLMPSDVKKRAAKTYGDTIPASVKLGLVNEHVGRQLREAREKLSAGVPVGKRNAAGAIAAKITNKKREEA